MDVNDFKGLLEKCVGRKVLDYMIRGGEVVAVLDNFKKVRVSVEDVRALDVDTAVVSDADEGEEIIDILIYSHPEKYRRDELRAAAAAVNIPGAWQMKKAELVAALKDRKK
ncbi:MAG: hypothetical protein OCU12_07795 [Methanophagales archaeon]|nr:hypothetical protein [Methanophagales archaeon]